MFYLIRANIPVKGPVKLKWHYFPFSVDTSNPITDTQHIETNKAD